MYTEKELVNHILSTLGESTTSTLETSHPAVLQAQQTLMSYNKEFQGLGWWFNREQNIKLLPDVNGRVLVPTETLSFRVTKCLLDARNPHDKTRFVKRGKYVYDTYEHTDVLNVAIYADITRLVDYEDLPQSAGAYLKHYAAECAFLADDGDVQVQRVLAQRTAMAHAALKSDELKSTRPNALESNHALNLRTSWVRGYGGRNPNNIGG